MKDEAPKEKKAPTFTFRQRSVLSSGFEMRTPQIVPRVKFWNSCQHLTGFDLAAGTVG